MFPRRTHADIEDAVADAVLRMLATRPRGAEDAATPARILWFAQRSLLNRLRDDGTHARLSGHAIAALAHREDDVERIVLAREVADRVAHVVRQDDHRQAIRLWAEGFDAREVATRCGVSVDCVRQWLKRGLDAVRKEMQAR